MNILMARSLQTPEGSYLQEVGAFSVQHPLIHIPVAIAIGACIREGALGISQEHLAHTWHALQDYLAQHRLLYLFQKLLIILTVPFPFLALIFNHPDLQEAYKPQRLI